MDFSGFKDMVDAVDGVEVCLTEPIDDREAQARLPAGRQTLGGEQALGYVRARKTIGNGSDTERMDRQQQFLGSLVSEGAQQRRTAESGEALSRCWTRRPRRSPRTRVWTPCGICTTWCAVMRDIPTEKVHFLTVPRQSYASTPIVTSSSSPTPSELFEQLREDAPVAVARRADHGHGESEAHEGVRRGSPTHGTDAVADFRGNAAVR